VFSMAVWFHHGLSDHRHETVDSGALPPGGAGDVAASGRLDSVSQPA
jgi:hypothetical protein